jgi:hypothetical protein
MNADPDPPSTPGQSVSCGFWLAMLIVAILVPETRLVAAVGLMEPEASVTIQLAAADPATEYDPLGVTGASGRRGGTEAAVLLPAPVAPRRLESRAVSPAPRSEVAHRWSRHPTSPSPRAPPGPTRPVE